jgi:hypothetical protein
MKIFLNDLGNPVNRAIAAFLASRGCEVLGSICGKTGTSQATSICQ